LVLKDDHAQGHKGQGEQMRSWKS